MWTVERWAAVVSSAATVATAGGVNRTALPSVTSSPAAAASRMSCSASARPARSSSSTRRAGGQRRDQQGLPHLGRQRADPVPQQGVDALRQRRRPPRAPRSGRRTRRPAPGPGTGCRRSRRAACWPPGPATRTGRAVRRSRRRPAAVPRSPSPAPGRAAAGPRGQLGAGRPSCCSGQRSATTARTLRPTTRRAAYAMTSADAPSSHCASSMSMQHRPAFGAPFQQRVPGQPAAEPGPAAGTAGALAQQHRVHHRALRFGQFGQVLHRQLAEQVGQAGVGDPAFGLGAGDPQHPFAPGGGDRADRVDHRGFADAAGSGQHDAPARREL